MSGIHSSALISILAVYMMQLVCVGLIIAALYFFKTRSPLRKQIPLLIKPFNILFLKGVVLSVLFVFNALFGSVMDTVLTTLVAFGFDCVVAATLLGVALTLSGITFNKKMFQYAVGALLVLGFSTLIFSGTRHIFPVMGPCFLSMEFLTVAGVLFMRPGTRKEYDIAALDAAFGSAGLASAALAVAKAGVVVIFLWQLAAVLVVFATFWGRRIYEKQIAMTLTNERRKVRLFLNASPFPILLTRLSDGQGLYMNSEAQRLFGLKVDDLKFFRLSSNFANPKDWVRLFTELKDKAVVNDFEVKIQNAKTGGQSWFTLDARALELEKELTLYTTFRDVTHKKDKENKLLQEASTDPLTGLFNRRQFDVMAGKYIQMAKRNKTNFCLMMMDIDFFKRINDTFGHEAGDAVLVKLAMVLKKVTRESDVLARYGGEEFVLFMPNTSQQEAYFAAERLRGAIEETDFVIGGQKYNVTVSVGLSAENVFELETMVKQADQALYIAKESGRNRTAFYEMGSEDI